MRLISLSLKLKMSNISDHMSDEIISFGDIFFCGIEKACLFQQKNMILLADLIKNLKLEERLDSSLPKAGNIYN